MISLQRLVRAMPKASEPWLQAMVETMPKWGIVGAKREAAFLGQLRHECADFTRFLENLNYSDPARIVLIFRKAFDADMDRIADPEEVYVAKQYVKSPERLANRAYANRFGNGNEASGDGWKYRGRGPIQTTFKDNYVIASKWTGTNLVLNPEEMMVPRVGANAACGYWDDHGCNALADAANYKEITRQINPGLAGLTERIALTNQMMNILEAP